ncbi:MAG TPA: hypothetical protein VN408_07105 [Actinoplanes sp.]|nr:hypothetical protein [Actinoplanes sp.]
MCGCVEPEHLKDVDVVFEGTVTAVTAVGTADVSVTIEVTHSFQGEAGETVLVRQDGGNPDALRGLYDEAF